MRLLHRNLLAIFTLLLASSCATIPEPQCSPERTDLAHCPPPDAVDDEQINALYELRTWLAPSEQKLDPIQLGAEAEIPVNHAQAKIIGPSRDDSLNSLAAKIWMIENAEHTVDATYYIFKRDPVGYALLGAMCNAVKRGVDVRIMVDSLGSLHPGHSELRALETCAEEAGWIRNEQGQLTTRRARVQVVIFNALTKLKFNRRSHDKLLVVDGHFDDKAYVMTGGRNVSLDYYGIKEDGAKDPNAYRDLEILIRPGAKNADETYSVGRVTEIYYTLLFQHRGNSRIRPDKSKTEITDERYFDVYKHERNKGQQYLTFIKSLPEVAQRYEAMPGYMSEGFHDTRVRLAHQLSNLTAQRVTTDVEANLERNPNSILYMISTITSRGRDDRGRSGTLRIVSPYLFSGKYKDENGDVVYDGARQTLEWLQNNPDFRLEVITNSVLTGDNVFTQAIIDMDMAPRFLLTPELQQAWLADLEESEFSADLVASEEWKRLIDHPQVFIYETGRLDSTLLDGDTHYGKLHAKYIVGDRAAFVGTSNFDYRSNLYNNEMGFFIQNPGVIEDLNEVFEQLKATSYRWGTAEWLEMRKKLMATGSSKGKWAYRQRGTFKSIRAFGLEYLM
jgi:putative cardiolipin synthase